METEIAAQLCERVGSKEKEIEEMLFMGNILLL